MVSPVIATDNRLPSRANAPRVVRGDEDTFCEAALEFHAGLLVAAPPAPPRLPGKVAAKSLPRE